MSLNNEPKLSAPDVLDRVRAEIARPAAARSGSSFDARMARIRSMQSDFRREPVGGKLLPLKKIVYWFAASAFDRQAKVTEALLDAVHDLGDETKSLRGEIAGLRAALNERRREVAGGGS